MLPAVDELQEVAMAQDDFNSPLLAVGEVESFGLTENSFDVENRAHEMMEGGGGPQPAGPGPGPGPAGGGSSGSGTSGTTTAGNEQEESGNTIITELIQGENPYPGFTEELLSKISPEMAGQLAYRNALAKVSVGINNKVLAAMASDQKDDPYDDPDLPWWPKPETDAVDRAAKLLGTDYGAGYEGECNGSIIVSAPRNDMMDCTELVSFAHKTGIYRTKEFHNNPDFHEVENSLRGDVIVDTVYNKDGKFMEGHASLVTGKNGPEALLQSDGGNGVRFSHDYLQNHFGKKYDDEKGYTIKRKIYRRN